MYKKNSSVRTIAFGSAGAFFGNLSLFIKYLFPPVLLQILATIFLGIGMFFLFMHIGGVDSGTVVTPFVSAVIAVAGIIILINALWSLLIKMGGLILISKQIIENEPLKEAEYYTNAFKNREGYIMYLLITGFIFPLILIALAFIFCMFTRVSFRFSGIPLPENSDFIIALTIVLCGIFIIFSPFLIITMQSFALNPRLTPWEAIVKGMRLSGGKYFQSLGLLILYTIITGIITTLMSIFGKMASAATGISDNIVSLTVQLLSQFLLPYWALCFTWWYLRMEKEDRMYGR